MDGWNRYAGELPWGWWLRAREGVLEDDEGNEWHTVRDALWFGELKLPPTNGALEQQELLLRVLTAIDVGWSFARERQHDLFEGNMAHWRFYMCWLASVGLTDARGAQPALNASLTPKGRSVMLMLQATRDPAWEALPIAAVIDAIAAAEQEPEDEERERALLAFERTIGMRRYVFARERVGRSRLVTLTGVAADARMPTRRVMWSLTVADDRARDDLFAWLARRVDRWDDWGQIAYRAGAKGLTQHLLGLVVQSGGLAS